MERDTPGAFEHAAQNHERLTARQVTVLELVARGQTNREIGEALGLTLDGAKWNVSEVLTKLGLSSREELAAYWKWRERRNRLLRRAARGLVSLSAFKFGGAAFAGGTAIVVALVLFLPLGGARSAGDRQDGSFHIEATVTVYDHARASAASTTAGPPQRVRQATAVRWRYSDGSHARWELETIAPATPVRRNHDVHRERSRAVDVRR